MSKQPEAARVEEMQSFSDATSWRALGEGRFAGEVDGRWGQGRAVYGGIVGAGLTRAMRASVADDRQLRSFSLTFAGPVEGGALECTTEVLRSGRSATFVSGAVIQGGTTRASATATFGVPRRSALPIHTPERPDAPPPEEGAAMPYLEGMTPSFTQRVDFRYTHGGFPCTGSTTPHIAGWCRFNRDSDAADAAGILALIDTWPAPALSMLGAPAPASSITWSVDLFEPRPDARLDEWWYFDTRTAFIADGYTSFEASLWAPDGKYVARSCQLVGVFG